MEISDNDGHVILVCTNPDPIETTDTLNEEILVSTIDILVWDLRTILRFQTIKVQAHRNRLIEQSLYFRGLLGGTFSESCLGSITIKWNVPVFMQILKHMCGCPLDITTENVLPLYEGALYFGVETLLLKCETWFSEVFSPKGFQLTQIQVEDLISIWKFGLDHASDFILHLCISYLARNFMWAKHDKFFGKIPYDLLLSSVKHPHLTVDSEMHLSDALLLWIESNVENLERHSEAEDNYNGILKQISGAALSFVIHENPSLKCLKARGCRNLFQGDRPIEKRESSFSSLHEELQAELGKKCRLEEIEFGWGFSSFSLSALKPALMSLKSINIGLGGMLDEDALRRLPVICPLLETIILHFQVISDIIVMELVTSLMNLQVLALCYCFGDITISSFKFPMQNLRKLRLERVTPWMTNDGLVILSQNCRNLVELSLLGCPLLNSGSQQIISRGWPGLVFMHLEECGEITANGVSDLFDCKALEDLLLRHNGPGLQRNFIFHAASEMPLLRNLSLDICDASEGDFDIPNNADGYFLSTLKIARCKSQRCAFNLPVPPTGGCRRSIHAETLVLLWNSRDLTRTVVKERL